MAAEPNMTGMARLIYLAVGAALAAWGVWGADHAWTQWTWLAVGGLSLVCGAIGYSPFHALFGAKK